MHAPHHILPVVFLFKEKNYKNTIQTRSDGECVRARACQHIHAHTCAHKYQALQLSIRENESNKDPDYKMLAPTYTSHSCRIVHPHLHSVQLLCPATSAAYPHQICFCNYQQTGV
jgi:hypothetical protein